MTGLQDPVALARALIQCPSVTPNDAGVLDVLTGALEGLGFSCRRLPFSEPGTSDVDNLFARLGQGEPHFCFAGHTDVVPVGDAADWSADPFAGEIRDDMFYGRGAADMKGAIACFVAAVSRFGPCPGSISLMITGDEEGPSINGTRKILGWLEAEDQLPDVCLVGEPTNPARLGEMVKVGRRGSLNGRLGVIGRAGHTAYPHLADNPINRLMTMLGAITSNKLDEGTDHFQPSTLEISSVDVGNPAPNVIPARAEARFNVRFNDLHRSGDVESWVRRHLDEAGGEFELEIEVSGEAFLTPPGPLSQAISAAVQKITGEAPELSTSGGTSDARYIKDYCPVAEFGLVGATMHGADERVALSDLADLTDIYLAVLEAYFETP